MLLGSLTLGEAFSVGAVVGGVAGSPQPVSAETKHIIIAQFLNNLIFTPQNSKTNIGIDILHCQH